MKHNDLSVFVFFCFFFYFFIGGGEGGGVGGLPITFGVKATTKADIAAKSALVVTVSDLKITFPD